MEAQDPSQGQFEDSVSTCGVGKADIIAEYYGSPGPEPVNVLQPSINYSVAFDGKGKVQSSHMHDYYEYNYLISPYTTSQYVSTGVFELSFNSINVIMTLLAITLGIVIALYRSNYKKKIPKQVL